MIDAAGGAPDEAPHDLPLALLAEAFGHAVDAIDAEGPAEPDALPAAVIAAVVLPAESGTGPAARL